jgi:hypothetical protein
MQCEKCGSRAKEADNFCRSCGATVSADFRGEVRSDPKGTLQPGSINRRRMSQSSKTIIKKVIIAVSLTCVIVLIVRAILVVSSQLHQIMPQSSREQSNGTIAYAIPVVVRIFVGTPHEQVMGGSDLIEYDGEPRLIVSRERDERIDAIGLSVAHGVPIENIDEMSVSIARMAIWKPYCVDLLRSATTDRDQNLLAAATSMGLIVGCHESAALALPNAATRTASPYSTETSGLAAHTQDGSVGTSYPNVAYSPPVQTVRSIDFPNEKYSLDTAVQLKNGKNEEAPDEGGIGDATELKNVWYLDNQRALVYLEHTFGQMATGYVLLFELKNGHPVVTEEIDLNMYAAGTGASFDETSRELLVKSRSNDGSPVCCPKHMDVVSFRWNGTLFGKTTMRVDEIPQ